MAEAYTGNDSIWAKWNNVAQANKEKRKNIGRWSASEPAELIAEEIENEELYDEDGRPINICPDWKHTNLYSEYWVRDLFGTDYKSVTKLLCNIDYDIVIVNEHIYYRERFISDALEILEILAKTSIVNALRPIPQIIKEQSNPVYTSADLMRILNVKEATLKKYRDKGLISYTKVGDKFWYTQKDLDDFLSAPNYHCEAFNQ